MNKFLLLVLVGFSLSACSTSKKNEVDREDDYPTRVIDSHTHTRFSGKPERSSGIIQTAEQYHKEFAENHVLGAVSHNANTKEGYFKDDEHHVVNCAGIQIPADYKAVEEGLKSKKYRCMKIYLGYVHAYPADKAYVPAYRLAEKYDVPVVFHTGDTYSTKAKLKFADPLGVDEVAVDYPKVTFVIAHCGNPWVESAAEVAYKNPNVYLDASAFLIGDLRHYSEENIEKLMVGPIRYVFNFVEDPSKMMFGTDWPLVGIKEYLRIFKRAIPKEHWDKVFYQNARHVFKMNELPE